MALSKEHKRNSLGNLGAELTDEEFHIVCKEIASIIDHRKADAAQTDFDDEKH